MVTRQPVALTIAGSDSSGGAGIQADLKTFMALKVYGASVITALTAQNTTGVRAVHVPPAGFIRQETEAVLDDLDVRATKTGMLADAETVAALAALLAQRPADFGPLIVDPVVIATSGDRLISDGALAAIRTCLLPHATLVTPNLAEAALLCGETTEAGTRQDALRQAASILELGCAAVLMKGGHQDACEEASDLLVTRTQAFAFRTARVATSNTHGTGCTLSAAIAAELALMSVETYRHDSAHPRPAVDALAHAVREAKAYLTAGLLAAKDQRLGSGSGPVDHIAAASGRKQVVIDMQPVATTPARR